MLSRCALILATCGFGLLLASASFAGNVLLPNDNADKSNLPNLGLMPSEPEPAAAPEPAPTPPLPPAATVTPPPVIAAPAKAPPTYTPAPVDPNAEPHPYSLTISIANPAWTPHDQNTINSQIGLSAAEVEPQCRIGFSGIVLTDHGVVSIESKISKSAQVAYGGAVTSTSINIFAACNSAPNPAKYAYIQKFDGKFIVGLGNAFCSPKMPKTGSVKKIVVTQTWNGADDCSFSP